MGDASRSLATLVEPERNLPKKHNEMESIGNPIDSNTNSQTIFIEQFLRTLDDRELEIYWSWYGRAFGEVSSTGGKFRNVVKKEPSVDTLGQPKQKPAIDLDLVDTPEHEEDDPACQYCGAEFQ